MVDFGGDWSSIKGDMSDLCGKDVVELWWLWSL